MEGWVPLRDRNDSGGAEGEVLERRKVIVAALLKLPPRLLHIVKRTHGFNGAPQTYEQLGAELALPPERVQALERLALDHLAATLQPAAK